MALSTQDIVKGIDFTGINPATAADHNNLVELSAPVLDSASEGKGYIVWTIDSALDTPIVPDAATTTKWKRYIWLRIPHSTATNKVPLFYGWSDSVVSIATFLKWSRVQGDTTVIEADIAALELAVADVEGVANNAASAAGVASTNAALALGNAATALATANTALANAQEAASDADAAQQVADNAFNLGTQGLAAANAAQITANNALTASAVVAANKFFTSAEYAVIDGIIVDVAHGLTGTPKFVRGVLVCQTAEFGYVIDDEIDLAFGNTQADDADMNPFVVGANATNVFACNTVGAMIFPSKTTPCTRQTLTPANWNLKLYAWL